MNDKTVGLYVHIPFCHAKCGYCDFATFVGMEDKVETYLSALQKEISLNPPFPLRTIYFGGGTPTTLSPRQITSLMGEIKNHFDVSLTEELTFEANPESATSEILGAFFQNGMNRVSFGLQTTDSSLLRKIDRLHSYDEFLAVYKNARDVGFKNISVDLIFGLPGQTLNDWKKTLETVLSLAPEHLSAYALKVEKGTKFASQYVEADDDLQADMYLCLSSMMKEAGYHHYEISNFAKPGFESKHNLLYWKNENTCGVGLSSASFIDGRRWKNTVGLVDYIERIENGLSPVQERNTLDQGELNRENLMLGLRLSSGVPQEKIWEIDNPIFKKFIDGNLAFVEKGMYCLSPKGWLLSNQLFQTLL